MLLASTYFGPVQWYHKLAGEGVCLVEACDSFRKQTFRNRCVIATANGTQALTVPVDRPGGGKMLMRDVRISDHGNWRHIHWNALLSAYGESPFFDYYADDIRPFFERRWDYLFDFNMEITETICSLIDIRPTILPTTSYIKAEEDGTAILPEDIKPLQAGTVLQDFRGVIAPKHPMPDVDFIPHRYYQVYERRHGFLPNLSVLDLLFNMGNESILVLKR